MVAVAVVFFAFAHRALRINVFRTKMNLVPQKEKVQLDSWCCKSFLSFIKGKTRKNKGSVVSYLQSYIHTIFIYPGIIKTILAPTLCSFKFMPRTFQVLTVDFPSDLHMRENMCDDCWYQI